MLASERVVGVSDLVDRGLWVLLRDSIYRRMRLITQTDPAGRLMTVGNGAVQGVLKIAAQTGGPLHSSNLRLETPDISHRSNI